MKKRTRNIATPFQRAYVLSGSLTSVNPSVPASVPRDADDR